MENSKAQEQAISVDGQVLESNLVDAKVERHREDLPAAAVTQDQNPGETSLEDKKPSDKVTEGQNPNENGVEDQELGDDKQLPIELPVKDAHQIEKEGLIIVPAEPFHNTAAATNVAEVDVGLDKVPEHKDADPNARPANQYEPVTPNSLVKCSNAITGYDSKETSKNWLIESNLKVHPENSTIGKKAEKRIEIYRIGAGKLYDSIHDSPKFVYSCLLFELQMTEDDESGTPEDQAAFLKELESFYRERSMEFKPPRFYGHPLNCLKTCTTVSWTFRIFYEKALLEYERHKRQSGELQLTVAALPEPSSIETEANDYQVPGSGRAQRGAAARAMQGWHVQRLIGYGEVGEPTIKDKNFNNMPKREKSLKSIGSVKHKRPTEVEHSVKAARTETTKQLVTTVADVGPPADWVKINVRETKDSFEVYALVPGLLREEVRVQSDPAGRLVITGQPEQPDNPWGITAFKKVVSLPARIDPLQTSAVVSLHGRLFVRVPFEQSNI
ncbi:hypothetical protein TEA_017095 [Camellia sinensis var. sinensis]|uniref:SHSP domain-containing protein n=1 Tax=Camellia sinensis var. sinensis TaxID=542762 RepID=A0A4S4D9R8_CAMSN|nr:hypothetical protein TEA_017095 [Camellia sinensis var. sinensis]